MDQKATGNKGRRALSMNTVGRQVVLPWKQVMKIAYISLRVRFFRSLITSLTLVFAVAFISYLATGYELLNGAWPFADERLQEAILSAGYDISQGEFGSTPKDRWLVILSLLVCVVGIVNAQLMAVTERFREIGTLKCLGALDSFVVKIFILESAYQGLFGGLTGGVLGLTVAVMVMVVKFGFAMVAHFPVVPILEILGGSALLAVTLSFLGVLYPALVASRMQPAIALRAEP
jgi:uncharacterized membrane protein YccF (DUF307 family)